MIDVGSRRFRSGAGACHNPGIDTHWEGRPGTHAPVVANDDPSVHGGLLVRAARPAA
jgi:hypothetical protein